MAQRGGTCTDCFVRDTLKPCDLCEEPFCESCITGGLCRACNEVVTEEEARA